MSSTAVQPKEPLRLKWMERGRKVIVEPEDQDRYVATVQDILNACQVLGKEVRFQKQFEDLLQRLAKWIDEHQAQVDHAFLTVHDNHLLFLVCMRTPRHDQKLEDSLTRLDLEIAQSKDHNELYLDVLAIPPVSLEAMESFASPSLCLEYSHAGRTGSRSSRQEK